MRNLTRGLLAVAILVGIGGFMLFLYHKTCIWLIDVHVVQYGELEDRVSTTAIVIKEETMVKASARGRLNKFWKANGFAAGLWPGCFILKESSNRYLYMYP